MMTREEATDILKESKRQNEIMRDNPSTFWASHQMAEGVKNAKRRIEALDVALTALRPVSREQLEKVWRGEWKCHGDCGVTECSACGWNIEEYVGDYNFCPVCGAPMTDEAVQMVIERMEAMHNDL